MVAAAGCMTAATAAVRTGMLDPRALASTPDALADGRVWLLVTSAVLAARPAAASILGFLVVGLVVVRLSATRLAWVAAAAGHVVSALAVYAALGLVHVLDPAAAHRVLSTPDYGASAIIAAWIGVIACRLWLSGRAVPAVGLVAVSGLLGWAFKGTLTVLDTEHAVALALGIAAMRAAPALEALRAPHGLRRVARRMAVVVQSALGL